VAAFCCRATVTAARHSRDIERPYAWRGYFTDPNNIGYQVNAVSIAINAMRGALIPTDRRRSMMEVAAH
jgi:hypothetical protein